MNKAELVKAISEKSELTQKDVATFVDSFTTVVTEALVSGEDVKITGFGSFSVGERAERNGVNPKTGESILIKACKTAKFKSGKILKETINQ